MTPTPTPPAARPNMPRVFGRFELRELVARSRRTMLLLALDPVSGREVCIGLPRIAAPDTAAAQAWLGQARQLSRLSHPHLLPVLECGLHDLWPYVVCERGAASTFDDVMKRRPAPSHQESARWIAQALQGLAYLHDAGFAHGDLQGWNLLVDDRGDARVMCAAVYLGTGPDVAPGEAWDGAARTMPLDPARLRAQRVEAERDVLSLGIVAHGLLAGERAMGEADVNDAIGRMTPLGREPLRLPWTTPLPISEALRTIVNRATHPQPRQRYMAARSFQRALDGWRAVDAEDDGGPVAVLLDRLRSVGHLPASPDIARTVRRLARMERQRTSEMASQVLKDLALSFEMLRLVNSAQVRGTQVSGNGPVLTVRRAIAMLGLDGVRHAATALRGWPGPLDEPAQSKLQALIDRVRLAGRVAQELRPAGYDGEVVFLLATLQNLGRLLLAYHFPDDASQISALMEPHPGAGADGADAPGMSEQSAAFAVLGTDIDALARATARQWGLTDEVVTMIQRLPSERPVRSTEQDRDLLRATASAANEVVDAQERLHGPALVAALEQVARRYGRMLGVQARDIAEALQNARDAHDQNLTLTAELDEPLDDETLTATGG